jgi:hypothetical protein
MDADNNEMPKKTSTRNKKTKKVLSRADIDTYIDSVYIPQLYKDTEPVSKFYKNWISSFPISESSISGNAMLELINAINKWHRDVLNDCWKCDNLTVEEVLTKYADIYLQNKGTSDLTEDIEIPDDNSMKPLFKIVDNNPYVIECKTNSDRDPSSFSYLIDQPLSQSDSIKTGIAMEKVISDFIKQQRTSLVNIKQKNKKGKKECDHLFADHAQKIIYYAELKTNLNLDTEKSVSTRDKCVKIETDLKAEYPDYEIKMQLVGVRYLAMSQCTKTVANKYAIIGANVVGVNEYFKNLNLPFQFEDEHQYKEFVNYVAKKTFK